MKQKLFFLIIFLFLTQEAFSEKCYLSSVSRGAISPESVEDIAIPLVSTFLQKVNSIPFGGISFENSCHFLVSIQPGNSSLTAAIRSNQGIGGIGESSQKDILGVRESISPMKTGN